MRIAGINCTGTLTHFSGPVWGADSGGTKLTTRSFGQMPCILHQLNNFPISLSSKFSLFSQTGSGSLLGSTDCSPPKTFFGGTHTEWSAKLRGESETVKELLDKLEESEERALLVWRSMHGIRPKERVSRPMPPESAPRTRPEKCVKVPVQLMPAIRTRSPVRLHRPVHPV